MSRRPCATISADHDEPMHARAGRTRAWVLLEHPGPWGESPLTGEHLDPAVGRTLAEVDDQPGVRVVLVRRHGRYTPDRHHCYMAWSGPGAPWIQGRVLDEPSEVRGADLGALVAGERPDFGTPVAGPLFLVCTHGSKDACCAQFGRPSARALSEVRGRQVWESTHVGGDRFAPNLVCLPHGLYFGRVGPDEVGSVAERYLAGEISLRHYRGRSCQPIPVQAADWHVRRLEGLHGIDDLVAETPPPADDPTACPARQPATGDGVERVVLTTQRHRYRVAVRREPCEDPRPRGCGDTCHWRPEHWQLVDLVREERSTDDAAPVPTSAADSTPRSTVASSEG